MIANLNSVSKINFRNATLCRKIRFQRCLNFSNQRDSKPLNVVVGTYDRKESFRDIHGSPDSVDCTREKEILLYEAWSGVGEVTKALNSGVSPSLLFREGFGAILDSLQAQHSAAVISSESYSEQLKVLLRASRCGLDFLLELFGGDFPSKRSHLPDVPSQLIDDEFARSYVHICFPSLGCASDVVRGFTVRSSALMTGQFRNCHTLVEVACASGFSTMRQVHRFNPVIILKQDFPNLIHDMTRICDILSVVHSIFECMSTIDKCTYLHYVAEVKGTSGGGSRQLLTVSNKIVEMEGLFDNISDEEIINAFCTREPKYLYDLLCKYLRTRHFLGKMWSYHQVMASGNIGDAVGTTGTTVVDGLSRLARRYSFLGRDGANVDRILTLLGSARQHVHPDGPPVGNELIDAWRFRPPTFKPLKAFEHKAETF